MSDLPKRVREYLDKYKPKPKVTESVIDEEVEYRWSDFLDEHRKALFVIKLITYPVVFIVFLWSLAVVDIQNDCYLDTRCREWMVK